MGRMSRTVAAAAILLVGCAPLEDAFVGEYQGPLECEGAFSDGTPYEEYSPAHVSVIQQRPDGSVFLAADACAVPIAVTNATRAAFQERTCMTVLPSGAPVTVTWYGDGYVELTDEGMNYRSSFRLILPGDRLFVNCNFVGERIGF